MSVVSEQSEDGSFEIRVEPGESARHEAARRASTGSSPSARRATPSESVVPAERRASSMKTAPAPRRASTSESITLSKERVEKKGIPLVVPLLGAVAIIGVAVFALRESGGDVANELPASSAATEFGPDAGADTGVTSASALPTLDAGMFTLDAGVEDVVPLQNVEFNFDDEPDTGGPELPSNVSVEADDSPVRNEIAIPQTIDPVTEDRLRQVRVELSEDELERMLERDPDAGR